MPRPVCAYAQTKITLFSLIWAFLKILLKKKMFLVFGKARVGKILFFVELCLFTSG